MIHFSTFGHLVHCVALLLRFPLGRGAELIKKNPPLLLSGPLRLSEDSLAATSEKKRKLGLQANT